MLSSNSTAALSFNDSKAADELLKGLSAKRGIIAATLYTSDGQVFARYVRPDGAKRPRWRYPALVIPGSPFIAQLS
jgi:hypothetical protein